MKDQKNVKVNLRSEEHSRVTYSELSDQFSHFEIAYLSFQKAIEIIRSAVYLNAHDYKTKYKPKIAVIALEQLCSDVQSAAEFKTIVKKQMFSETHDESKEDTYNVDEGHLPKQNSENS